MLSLTSTAILYSMLSLTSATDDHHSYANFDQIDFERFDLDLQIDFQKKVLNGKVRLKLKEVRSNQVILDTNELVIKGVSLKKKDGTTVETKYELGKYDEILGQPLIIDLPGRDIESVEVTYSTQPGTNGLGWVDAKQAADGKTPWVYLHSSSHNARRWIPYPDSPTVRLPGRYNVQAEKGMLVAATGLSPTEKNETGFYSIDLPYPIPSYLLALLAGNFEYAATGPRTGVYGEPQMIKNIVEEYGEELEAILEVLEEYNGPLPFPFHRIAFMGRSFPIGGMEYPMLNFLNPAMLTGRALNKTTVAHEMVHNWPGGSVTIKTWPDFWLNEGPTMFITSKAVAKRYGKRVADLEASRGYEELLQAIERKKEEGLYPDTRLKPDFTGRSPNEKLSAIYYEKGFLFFKTLEDLLGEEAVKIWFQKYFRHFAFQSISTEQFLEYLEAELIKPNQAKLAGKFDPREWIYGTGLPTYHHKPSSEAALEVQEVAALIQEQKPIPSDVIAKWGYAEHLFLLDLLEAKKLTHSQLQSLDKLFHFSNETAVGILRGWYTLVIKAEYFPEIEKISNFLTTMAVGSFTPNKLFREMLKFPWGLQRVTKLMKDFEPHAHAVTIDRCRQTIEKALKK